MGNKKKTEAKSRRDFFSLLLQGKTGDTPVASSGEKVKMLTADGKLVEVDKTILEKASKKQKSSNKEIFDWMNNPSKENSEPI